MDLMTYVHGALAVSGMVSVICRLKAMSMHTKAAVRWQHGLLFAGLLWSLLVPKEHAALPVLGGVVAFLLLSADRWRSGPPAGTTQPMPLEHGELKHVSGGRRAP